MWFVLIYKDVHDCLLVNDFLPVYKSNLITVFPYVITPDYLLLNSLKKKIIHSEQLMALACEEDTKLFNTIQCYAVVITGIALVCLIGYLFVNRFNNRSDNASSLNRGTSQRVEDVPNDGSVDSFCSAIEGEIDDFL